ncbi:MAG: hypothetical protein F4101_00540 [Nitrospira sp. SB0673_bin_12]|nr:hypothetical protein [Nitrospira sp. SB0673_bin_12]
MEKETLKTGLAVFIGSAREKRSLRYRQCGMVKVLSFVDKMKGWSHQNCHSEPKAKNLLSQAVDGRNDEIPRYARNDNPGVISASI